jgi:hypothetical protein
MNQHLTFKCFLNTLLVSSIGCTAFAQSISNVVSSQQGNNAIISYDLNGAPGTTYYVKLFYSLDGGQIFGNELHQVSGDVKSGVKSGAGKKIIWAAEKEVNFLNGPIIFKVEGEARKPSAKPVTIENVTLEIMSAKKNGDELVLDFLVTQNTERDIVDISLFRDCELTAQDGTQYLLKEAKFGTKLLDGNSAFNVNCQKGIPTKGTLKFDIENSDLVIPAVKVHLYPIANL